VVRWSHSVEYSPGEILDVVEESWPLLKYLEYRGQLFWEFLYCFRDLDVSVDGSVGDFFDI